MTYAQIASLFVALSISSYLGMKLRSGYVTPLHGIAWAAAVVVCLLTFVGIR